MNLHTFSKVLALILYDAKVTTDVTSFYLTTVLCSKRVPLHLRYLIGTFLLFKVLSLYRSIVYFVAIFYESLGFIFLPPALEIQDCPSWINVSVTGSRKETSCLTACSSRQILSSLVLMKVSLLVNSLNLLLASTTLFAVRKSPRHLYTG